MKGNGGGAASLGAIVAQSFNYTPFQAVWGHRKFPLSIVMDMCFDRG